MTASTFKANNEQHVVLLEVDVAPGMPAAAWCICNTSVVNRRIELALSFPQKGRQCAGTGTGQPLKGLVGQTHILCRRAFESIALSCARRTLGVSLSSFVAVGRQRVETDRRILTVGSGRVVHGVFVSGKRRQCHHMV